ncbi:MAG: S41 family peptidase [Planctomycetota bacterium]
MRTLSRLTVRVIRRTFVFWRDSVGQQHGGRLSWTWHLANSLGRPLAGLVAALPLALLGPITSVSVGLAIVPASVSAQEEKDGAKDNSKEGAKDESKGGTKENGKGGSKSGEKDIATPKRSDSELKEERELLRLFVDTLDQVERNYVKDISRRELYEAAIRGLVSKLDQHSNYIPPDEIESFKGTVENEFGGVGIQVSRESGRLLVISPLVGTPAYRAGIQAGDWITAIDGAATRDITLDEAVKRMKGPIGTSVRVTVLHARDGRSETLTLRREVVRVETVLGDRRKPDDSWNFFLDESRKIGYIRITAFGRHTTNETRSAVKSLVDQGVRGLIIDLRFNPGGLLSSAVEISDLFVSEGRIVSTAGRNVSEQVIYAKKPGTYEGFPMAVLVNRFSASASEIVSACLQDHGRAIVVGERTWGKGSVQNIIELEGGRSALKLTTAGYQRPNGRNINRFEGATEEDEWGVSPNDGYAIRLPDEELRQLIETRRERDILKRPVAAKPDDKKPGDEKPDNNKPDDKKQEDKEPEGKKPGDTKPDAPSSGTPKPDVPKPDAPKPDVAQPAGRSEPEGAPHEAALKGDRQLSKAFDYLLGKLSDKPADAKP